MHASHKHPPDRAAVSIGILDPHPGFFRGMLQQKINRVGGKVVKDQKIGLCENRTFPIVSERISLYIIAEPAGSVLSAQVPPGEILRGLCFFLILSKPL